MKPRGIPAASAGDSNGQGTDRRVLTPSATRPKSAGTLKKGNSSSRLPNPASSMVSSGPVDEPPEPVHLPSDAEVSSELVALSKVLDLKVDWEKRVAALKRLHGIAIGGGCVFPAFMERMRSDLRDPVISQLLDRRSQVSRVACAAVQVCASSSGQKFEPIAVTFLPELLKVGNLSVVVMSDAAHDCIKGIFQSCHSVRLLRVVIEALLNEKSSKLRQRCSEYVHQVLLEWPASLYESSLAAVRSAVRKAVADASPDVRNVGRAMFTTYAGLFPSDLEAVLKGLDFPLQAKLRKAVEQAGSQRSTPTSSSSARPERSLPRKPGGAAGPSGLAGPASHTGPGGTGTASTGPSSSAAGTPAAVGAEAAGTLSMCLDRFEAARVPGSQMDWSAFETHLTAATRVIDGSCMASTLTECMPRLAELLAEGLDHKHVKVQTAAVDLLKSCLDVSPAAFDDRIVELFPLLTALYVGRYHHTQMKARGVLNTLAETLPADLLVVSMVQSLRQVVVWKAKAFCYEYFVQSVGSSTAAGTPADSKNVGVFVSSALESLSHSMADVRKHALQAVVRAHSFCPEEVVRALSVRIKPELTDANQMVMDAIPGLQTEVNASRYDHPAHQSRAQERRPFQPRAEAMHSNDTTIQSGSMCLPTTGSVVSAAPSSSLHTDENRLPSGDTELSAQSVVKNGTAPAGIDMVQASCNRMDMLLANINSNPRNCGAQLGQVRLAVNNVSSEVWLRKIHAVVNMATRILLLNYFEVLPEVCQLLVELTRNLPDLVQPHIGTLCDSLLDVYNILPVEDQPILVKRVEEALDMLAAKADTHSLIEHYTMLFPSPASVMAGTATHNVNKLRKLAAMARDTIVRCRGHAHLEQDVVGLLPGMHAAMETDCTAVRMRITETWVAAFSVLGGRLQPYMASLTMTQKRLINLYITRMKPVDMQVAASSADMG